MIYGYARVSTNEQLLEPQLDRLMQYGIASENIYSDYAISGSTKYRPVLDELLLKLKRGDTLVVVKLDRLGRSLKHLMEVIEDFKNKGINFVSITEGMDTNTSTGRLLFHIFGAIAEFERDLITERIKAGIASAQKRGVNCGHPHKLNKEQVALLHELRGSGKSPKQIQRLLDISHATYYRYISLKQRLEDSSTLP